MESMLRKEKNMINIGICEAAPLGACSYYRTLGPFSKLRKKDKNINISHIVTVSWPALTNIDILMLGRPADPNYIDAIKTANNFGIKTWIDFDDCLHEIPEHNPSYEYYRKPRMDKSKLPIDYMIDAIEMADIMTVSTQGIKDYYSKFRNDIIVIENAFNDYNFPFQKQT